MRVFLGNDASVPADGRPTFLVYGVPWFQRWLPYLLPTLAQRSVSCLAVLPERGETAELSEAILARLAEVGVETVYAPGAEVFWPARSFTRVTVEGPFRRHGVAYRPGYYTDRITATFRLLGMLATEEVWEFGSDYHWVAIWRRVRRDLVLRGAHHFLPPPREEDGLLVRPETADLSQGGRRALRHVYDILRDAEVLFRQGEVEATRLLGRTSARLMRVPGYRVQYLSLVDPDTLEEREVAQPGDVLLVGGFLGALRLEDYWILGGSTPDTSAAPSSYAEREGNHRT